MVHGLRWWSVRLAVVAVALMLSGAPRAASAQYDANTMTYDLTYRTCSSDYDQYATAVNIGGSFWMGETGKSGFTQMRATFLLYKQGGINLGATYRKSYTSAVFPNDNKNYRYPGTGYKTHTFKDVPIGYTYELKLKLTWVRDGLPDSSFTTSLGTCAT